MRAREVLALLLGLAVVGAAGYLGYNWFLDETDPDTREETEGPGAAEVASNYLAAWEVGDLEAMRALLGSEPPEDFDQRHEQLVEALAPTRMTITPGAVTEPTEGRAVVAAEVALQPDGAPGVVRWDIELPLTRTRGVWSVDWSLSVLHPELRPTWGFATETEEVPRRPILAADGTELASDDGRWIGFVPGLVDDADQVSAAFERVLPGTGAGVARQLAREDLVDDWFYPVVTVSRARADAAWVLLRRVPGVVEPRTPPEGERRVLLDLDFARHLVGVVSEATAEQLEELAEQGIDAPVGTWVPQFGLEEALDDQLTGSEVFRVGLRDQSTGELTVTIDEVQAEPSSAVATTIDVAVQRAVENTLAGVETTAAIVVVDGADGAILGTASRPLGGFDRARTGRYPPGSTFKLVTLEAALAAGADLDDPVGCPARTVVGGLAVRNAGDIDLGTVTLAEAFAASCNTTFAELGAELGADALTAAADRFGFGVGTRHPLATFDGSFPEPVDTAELAAAAFGQARVESSPLHLAAMVAAVTGGVWHPPYLLSEDGPGTPVPLATGAADRLRTALALAVTDGTGNLAAVEGVEVAGKTGTAQNDSGADHAWFVGTVDGLGFAILIENGGAGGEVAAPLAARLVAELVRLTAGDIDPTDPLQAGPGGPVAPDPEADGEDGGEDAEDEEPTVQPEG